MMDILSEILKSDLPIPNGNSNNELMVINVVPDVTHLANNDITQDAQESRNNIRQLLAQGTQSINDLLLMAKTTNTPRAYEVLANLLKTVAELNHDLMKIHADEQSLTGPDDPQEIHNHIDKAVFVGSTAELGEMMKGQAKQNVDSSIEVKEITEQ